MKEGVRTLGRRMADLADVADKIEHIARNAASYDHLKSSLTNLALGLRERVLLLQYVANDLISDAEATSPEPPSPKRKGKKGKK